MYVVRSATESDAYALAGLSRQLGYPTTEDEVARRLPALLAKANHRIYVAVGETGIVGYISFEHYDTIYWPSGLNITGLVVYENQRNKGIGKCLISAAEQYAREHKLSFLRANSGSQRTDAHEFYRKNGFTNEKDQKRFVKEIGVSL
jgi:GNAT superfamily N-acetyltransferase